jgi:hypothetical protein
VIGEGNLVELVEQALPIVGEIQVADVPGRCEPGAGEIHYPAVAAALNRLGYTGVVGLEGWASGDPDEALTRCRTAFTVQDLNRASEAQQPTVRLDLQIAGEPARWGAIVRCWRTGKKRTVARIESKALKYGRPLFGGSR